MMKSKKSLKMFRDWLKPNLNKRQKNTTKRKQEKM